MIRQVRSPWQTPGMQEALEAYLGAGMSAGQTAGLISRTFRIYVSRSAVIGRAHRTEVEIKGHKSQGADVNIPPTPRGIRGGRPKSFVIADVEKELKHPPEEPKPRGDVPDGCRWIFGNATKRNFCGAPTKLASSWCHHHAGRVFVVKAESAKEKKAAA